MIDCTWQEPSLLDFLSVPPPPPPNTCFGMWAPFWGKDSKWAYYKILLGQTMWNPPFFVGLKLLRMSSLTELSLKHSWTMALLFSGTVGSVTLVLPSRFDFFFPLPWALLLTHFLDPQPQCPQGPDRYFDSTGECSEEGGLRLENNRVPRQICSHIKYSRYNVSLAINSQASSFHGWPIIYGKEEHFWTGVPNGNVVTICWKENR